MFVRIDTDGSIAMEMSHNPLDLIKQMTFYLFLSTDNLF